MLRDHSWPAMLEGGDHALLEQLYEPGLKEAVRYDRCCAYFASSVLATAARGFGGLIQNLLDLGADAPRPAVRLLVNEELDPEDVDALLERGDTSVLEQHLLNHFTDPVDALTKARLEMLAYLAASGLLEVRVGVMRSGRGILHSKHGQIYDVEGEALTFAGSGNESRNGLIENFETIEITGSWQDGPRQARFHTLFEKLWSGQHETVATVSLPDAVAQHLIKFAPKAPPKEPTSGIQERQTALMRLTFALEAPFTSAGGDTVDALAPAALWPHQRHVVAEVAEAWPEGRLLCDEVGMGKTLEAITSLRRLMAGRGVKRALLLVPAGLLLQWQNELREKGALTVARLEGQTLIWPNGKEQKTTLAQALKEDLLLMSRETARMPQNRALLLAATPWDLVILDESHAARRKNVSEVGEYNSASLLLELLRQLQLRRQARSVMLLSATPMQTHPWEPWDLLAILGEGGGWLADFETVELLYRVAQGIERERLISPDDLGLLAHHIASDPLFASLPGLIDAPRDEQQVRAALGWISTSEDRRKIVAWLRGASPLGRRMHRNTRDTLRHYHSLGLLDRAPATRNVQDVQFDFQNEDERAVYSGVSNYIQRRFDELADEEKRSGKGFVLTVYRRRAASSLNALEASLRRRAAGLHQVVLNQRQPLPDEFEGIATDDLPDTDDANVPVTSSLPNDPARARLELAELEPLLEQLSRLGWTDTKRDTLRTVLGPLTAEARPVLIFTQYADTMRYLRSSLMQDYGDVVGSYSGEGGSLLIDGHWKAATKAEVTQALKDGRVRYLVCTDAASEGLNLQAASAVVNYDLPWNPSRVEQRIGRVDRIGQVRSVVRIINIHLRDSVDDQVYQVLQQRCGLFTHFVGQMQPVLALARRMLEGKETVSIAALNKEITEADRDTVRAAPYQSSRVPVLIPAFPALELSELVKAFTQLPSETGISIESPSTFTLGGQRYSTDATVLESDRATRPVDVLDRTLRTTLNTLMRPGERLPLVVATVSEGAFRRSVIGWVTAAGAQPVPDQATLEELLSSWSGQMADPQRWVAAQNALRAHASGGLQAMVTRAEALEIAGLQRQHLAAQRRLMWQFGKYAACRTPQLNDPNGELHRLMLAETTQNARMRSVYRRMDYPEWPEAWMRALRQFGKTVKTQERKNRLSGKQLDAALGDPRWPAGTS